MGLAAADRVSSDTLTAARKMFDMIVVGEMLADLCLVGTTRTISAFYRPNALVRLLRLSRPIEWTNPAASLRIKYERVEPL